MLLLCSSHLLIRDLLLCVHVVVKTLNSEISRHLADTSENSTEVRAARAARLVFLIQPIRLLFPGVVVALTVVLTCKKPNVTEVAL